MGQFRGEGGGEAWTGLLLTAGQFVLAVVAGLLVHRFAFYLAERLRARGGKGTEVGVFLRHLRRPSLLVFPLLAVQVALPSMAEVPAFVGHLLTLAAYGAITWVVIGLLGALEEFIKGRHDVGVADNLDARRVHTQISVLTRSLMVVTVVVGVAASLMTFEGIRALGTAMLASAGLAGLVIGLAARPVLENLFAGLQIALTQPIRLDDVVIIDGEWGRIEEIAVTYVVVRIWDQRRLIVPFSRIISQPFQNWTRQSADIMGTVFIHTDYTVSVEALREELGRVVKDRDEWDGRVCVLQVTDATPTTLELRALVSAGDAGKAWDLRVHVREALVAFLQREYPESLPRTRVVFPEAEDGPGEVGPRGPHDDAPAPTDQRR